MTVRKVFVDLMHACDIKFVGIIRGRWLISENRKHLSKYTRYTVPSYVHMLKADMCIAIAAARTHLPHLLTPCMLTPNPLSTSLLQAQRTSTPWSIERSRRTQNQSKLHQRLCIRYCTVCCIKYMHCLLVVDLCICKI